MKSSLAAQMEQIHIGRGHHGYEAVLQQKTEGIIYAQEHEKIQATLLAKCPAHLWHNDSYRAACPRPILIDTCHQQQLEELHEALTAAITDIVQRWWTDRDARFPERMPLEREEEKLLQKFPECLGSWRPDFLVEDSRGPEDGDATENFRITEINARFSFNGFMHEAYGQQALDDMGVEAIGLKNATDPEKILNGLFGLFRPEEPLHLLKGEEHGIDIHMFIDIVRSRFGVTPKLIKPEDLRLLPDPQGKGGYRLCCIAENVGDRLPHSTPSTLLTSQGEVLEEIHQIGMELHQRELLALEPEILRQVSLRCFNDMRTILLVHDKRMLGIVKQELQSLVLRKVLTTSQARILDRGIVETMLPGSQELIQLFQASKNLPELKNDYLLKPVRGGKGAGIVFGDEFSPGQWIAALDRLKSPGLISGVTCVVQRRIVPRLYDVVLKASGERLRYPLVGTYHVANGELLGLGTWRSSGSRICANPIFQKFLVSSG
ncbi:hypothetical protein AK830_g4830 [Neonectria ditissima]|uniref:Uncharacterized protein n=1 Tax=Neonectria ditissima TaxID=78410 RepID=A0A0P7BMZ7_9HYPO|nr:hypothetical protein AK830_g4830 [Neonectria ditissima]